MTDILIICADPISSIGISTFIQDAVGQVQIAYADEHNLVQLLLAKPFDLLVIIIDGQSGPGIYPVAALLKHQPSLKLLFISEYPEKIYAKHFLKEGAYGYIQKNNATEQLTLAVTTILKGEKYLSTTLLLHFAKKYLGDQGDNPFEELTKREMEICSYLLKGKGTTAIAKLLNLRSSTVATHKMRIFQKLDIKTSFDFFDVAQLYNMK